MNKLLRYWNQNRKKIITIISIIVLSLILIQVANNFAREKHKKQSNNLQNNVNNIKDVTRPNISIASDEKLNENETTNNSEILKKFIENCNNKNIKEAYNMLSKDCKNELYKNNIEEFNKNYINKIFTTFKSYELELWQKNNNKYTYKVIYQDGNPLQTGQANNTNNFLDYITIVKENKELKLNINNFVCNEELSRSKEEKDVVIKINSKKTYIDYEIYNITVINNSENKILLNNRKNIKDIYLTDSRGHKYFSLIYELPSSALIINSKDKNTFELKFNKNYNTISNINTMEINNIQLEYEENMIKDENSKVTSIKINL